MAATSYKICTLPGDGIGPEIMDEAKHLLAAIGEAYDVNFNCDDQLIGGCAIDATSAAGAKVSALPPETLVAAREADAARLPAWPGLRRQDPPSGA